MSQAKETPSPLQSHVIIVGFGVPGRLIAESLDAHHVPFCVIETNPQTISRCSAVGVRMVLGDARNPEVLQEAGLQLALMLAITLPDESACLEVISSARRIAPTLPIIARCAFTSGGLQATQRGANDVIVAEQAVAWEFARVVHARLFSQQAETADQ